MKRSEIVLKEIEARRNQRKGIANFEAYLHTINDIHKKLTCIHIAGTNGKGSTLNDIRSVLQLAGYRVATFTSPYLETHYDRIRINDEFISEESFLNYYDTYHQGWYEYGLSAFEIDTVIAFLYFNEQKADICLIEAGIGGRLDCTNVITPLLSVITNIGMDHMEYLGATRSAIAWQKGGIIKANIPAVIGEKHPEAVNVLTDMCQEQSSPYVLTKSIIDPKLKNQELHFTYDNERYILTQPAYYQGENCACAIEALKILKEVYHYAISKEILQEGLKAASWKGRFETVWEKPLIIIDGAHNEDGIRALCKTLETMGSVRILFSALKDKETNAMLEMLCASGNDVTVTEFDFYRCKKAVDLAIGLPVNIEPDYQKAIQTATEDTDTPLIITGSLYFISEVRAYLKQLSASSNR